MKAKDLIRVLLYKAQDTQSKGLFHNNNCEDYNALEAMFGSNAIVIKGELQEGTTYLYDYSNETIKTAKVIIADNCGERVLLTPIED